MILFTTKKTFNLFRKWSFILLLLSKGVLTFAQETNDAFGMIYQDNRDYLYYFKQGVFQQLETQKVRSFDSRGAIVGYVNNANNLIAYYNGEKTNLGDLTGTTFSLTNHLLVYQRDQVLAVFDRGKVTRLTYFVKDYKMNDEFIVYRDKNIDALKLYAKGQVVDIDLTLIGALGAYKVGKNSLAYVNSSGYFKIYYEGQFYEIDNLPPVKFEAGKNIVGYVVAGQEALKIFYNSKEVTLETISPLSFQVGDDLIAYVSDEGYFKVFTQGRLIKVETSPPDFYIVKDASVLFFANNKLQILQYGIRNELDMFQPINYKISENCVAWQDPSGRLFMYLNGKVKTVSTEKIVNYELNGDILRYEVEDGTSRIYYNNNTYTK